ADRDLHHIVARLAGVEHRIHATRISGGRSDGPLSGRRRGLKGALERGRSCWSVPPAHTKRRKEFIYRRALKTDARGCAHYYELGSQARATWCPRARATCSWA